jgi:hypothetical protein
MTFPVLDDSADDPYHSIHRRMNFIVDGGGAILRNVHDGSGVPLGDNPDVDRFRGNDDPNDPRPLSWLIPLRSPFALAIDLRRRDGSV